MVASAASTGRQSPRRAPRRTGKFDPPKSQLQGLQSSTPASDFEFEKIDWPALRRRKNSPAGLLDELLPVGLKAESGQRARRATCPVAISSSLPVAVDGAALLSPSPKGFRRGRARAGRNQPRAEAGACEGCLDVPSVLVPSDEGILARTASEPRLVDDEEQEPLETPRISMKDEEEDVCSQAAGRSRRRSLRDMVRQLREGDGIEPLERFASHWEWPTCRAEMYYRGHEMDKILLDLQLQDSQAYLEALRLKLHECCCDREALQLELHECFSDREALLAENRALKERLQL